MSKASSGATKGGEEEGSNLVIAQSLLRITSWKSPLGAVFAGAHQGWRKGWFYDAVTVTKWLKPNHRTSESTFSKRYLKYLTKKYLKKNSVRDWLRVISSNKDRNVYELRYFNIADNEAEEED
ncbi:60S ribosomal protein L22 [Datura stramonium]|uniref:Large ribosomal subunit protein eL22 n=1 Tax=Datura stramonium TaxID=4076 RepID=A0ABS8T582_DATST|nr:60S ribosomal protein L22 [Datura stramonium]